MRLLLIEDEADLASAVGAHLRAQGHAVDLAPDLEMARISTRMAEFDLILLDLGLPDGNGLDFLRELRQSGHRTPVLITTARDQIMERIAGLEAGADDYLLKPYDLGELVARVTAIHRRAEGLAETDRRFGALRIVPQTRAVYLEDAQVHLTRKEWAVLERLSRRADVTVSREQLEGALYAFDDEIASNALEAHISRLRAKLGRAAIETERGFGYRMGRA
ncbi:transcriptional regulator [Thioclava dalianensis]|uniref:Transcriptional regulator n=1 Tax=Thioclava dalianensis TaxID=1185766 RepID=A0A074U220_9RHOB|nr:response regulator transcription factor [Thioclava dalianensis]KEP68707.1 transcriptional regulator [Thioclava dalianensis]SFN58868.1 two-component system, OmpR family, response regulator [Thioclava dalianensis]